MDKYYYGVGRVRALETHLLSPDQLARMAGASDFETSFAVLSETPYAEHFPQLKHPFDFEELTELELVSLKKLMGYLAPGNEIIEVLFKKYDYLNAKILLKAFFSGDAKIENLSKTGGIEFKKLKLYIFEGTREFDDKKIVEAIDKAKSSFEQSKDPQTLDTVIEKHFFSYFKERLNQSSSPLIKEFVNQQLDIANIKTLLRCQDMGKLEASLLDTGLIDKDILQSLYAKTPHEIAAKLSFTPYFPTLAEGFDFFDKNKSFYLLEKAMDDYIILQFRKAKYLNSGVEPLVGFYLAKEREIKSVRFILICKKNYVELEEIRQRIRVSYA